MLLYNLASMGVVQQKQRIVVKLLLEHWKSTLQTLVTFSQKSQTKNRKLSFFAFLCDHKMGFEIDSCEVIAKFKLFPQNV